MSALLGTSVGRREDAVLLTGAGHYTADVPIDDCLVAHFVRSPFAHASIESIDVSEAEEMPGVVAVHTRESLGLGPIASRMPVPDEMRRPTLSDERVRFVGEPVACVIATSAAAAADAAEMVFVDYEPLDVVIDTMSALTPGTTVIHDSVAAANGGANAMWTVPPDDRDLHAEADVVITARVENTRMAVSPIEPYSITVRPDGDDHLTIWYSAQGAHAVRDGIAASLGLDQSQVHVIVPWVGGGFGAKGMWNPEHVVVARAAQLSGRPVRWVETRSENLLSMHGRHQVQFVRAGSRHDGTLTSFEAFVVSDAGGYLVAGGFLPTATRLMAQGCYHIPEVRFDHAVAFTNTTPLLAFRGAGRPQATALIERTVDLLAHELDLDPLEIRRRNFIAPEAFPITTATGATYDTGEYENALDVAADAAGYTDLRAEQRRRREAGDRTLLGVGVCSYVEITGGFSPKEYAAVELDDDGRVTVKVGTVSNGHGHETTFCALAADRLGVPMDRIDFVQGDTDQLPRGAGTGGSRSAQIGGSAIDAACDILLAQATELAAAVLGASIASVELVDGKFTGPDDSTGAITWDELASSDERAAAAASGDDPLIAETDFDQDGATYPFGTHISVVEVDRDTGHVTIVRHIAVDDAGIVLNPAIFEGQQHGGAAAGISQAMWEHVVYDEDGNPLATTFAEYGIPSAAELPSFEAHHTVTPTPMNPLGVKGVGEAGTIGATPAVQNAVIDALSHLGVRHLDMPLTAEKVWRAIRDAEAGVSSEPLDWATVEAWRTPPV